MAKYDYLNEMRIRFANPRLKEFISDACLPEQSEQSLNCNDDKNVELANYIFRKSLAISHKAWMQIVARLKINKIMSETFGVHYDTSVLQIMTWIRFSIDSRDVEQILAGERSKDDSPNGIESCLGLSSAFGQYMLTELMGSGDDSGEFKAEDNLIKKKVDTAYEKNQALLISANHEGKDHCSTMAYILLYAMMKNSEEALLFSLDKWVLSAAERKQITKKLNTPLKEEDDKNIALILYQTIKYLEDEIDVLYKNALKVHSQFFKT